MGRAREIADLIGGTTPDIILKTSDGAILNLQTSDTTVTADSVLGAINFQAPDEASGTDSILIGSKIEAIAEGTFSASSNATSLVFSTASSAAAGTVSGKMTFTSGGNLIIKDTDTADGSSPTITLQSGDTDIAANDVLGSINFQAPDEGTGTDAILVAAGIEAVSEGDFSSSSNATKLVFKTGASEAAASKMTLSSGGVLDVDGGITVDNITIDGTEIDLSSGDLTIDVAGDITLDADGADIILKDGGSTFGTLTNNSGTFLVNANTNITTRGGIHTFDNTDGSSEYMRIDSSGNVGIGASSPTDTGSFGKALDVSSSTGAAVYVRDSGGSKTGHFGQFNEQTSIVSRQDDGNIAFYTGASPSEKMRIDADGNVGIGDSSPESNNNFTALTVTSTSSTGGGQVYVQSSSVNSVFGADATSDPKSILQTVTNHPLILGTNNTERARIDTSGNVGINRTAASTIKLDVETSGSNHPARFKSDNVSFGTIFDNIAGSGNRFFCDFRINNSTKGKIFSDGSTTTYSTSSDYRLKENVVTDWDATTRLKQLKPSRFNFKENKDITYDGFLAHEVSSIVPEAVDGEKDAVDKDGNIEAQGIDHSKLVPLLTKSLQEAVAKIETLEAEVKTLKGE